MPLLRALPTTASMCSMRLKSSALSLLTDRPEYPAAQHSLPLQR